MKKKVLWIDDEYHRIEGLVNDLKEENIDVIIAHTPKMREAEMAKNAGTYDLVILDIKLLDEINITHEQQREKGKEILINIKKKWPNTPVLVFTAKIGSRDEMIAAEADDYIEKPIPLQQFRDVVFKLLDI
jgi:DNA-binding response OmpR family regulator